MSNTNRKGDRLLVGGIPRAELLPPELELEKKARSQRRGLVTVFVLIVILVGVGYGATALTAAAMQLALDGERQKTEQLLAAQNEYIEVRQLAAQVSASESARLVGTSTEIDWQQFVYDIIAEMPAGTRIGSLQMTSATPISAFSDTVVPLEQPRVAEVLIGGVSPTYGPQSIWLEGLEDLPGFADASMETLLLEDGEYEFVIRLHLNQDAFTNRFAIEDSE
jgi:hypothetical protein